MTHFHPERSLILVLALIGLFCAGFLHAADNRQKLVEYGPYVTATIDSAWPRGNIAYKGIAVRLTEDGKDVGGIVYDTDLLRMASAWTGGFLDITKDVMQARDYRSILPAGQPLAATAQMPGWSKPGTASFTDPRERPFGPLPRDWAKYQGLYLHGDRVVLKYLAGQATVQEQPQAERADDILMVTRSLQISGITGPLQTVICERGDTRGEILSGGAAAILTPAVAGQGTGSIVVSKDRAESNGNWLAMGFATRTDFASRDKDVFATYDEGGPAPHAGSVKEKKIPLLKDGNGGQYDVDEMRSFFFEGDNGIIYYHLGKAVDVRSIESFSWHRDAHAPQHYRVYGSNETERPAADARTWQEIAAVDTTDLGQGGVHGVRIARDNGGSIGTYRYLMFKLLTPAASSTWFTEIDVRAEGDAPKFEKMPADLVMAAALVHPAPGEKLVLTGDSRIDLQIDALTPARRTKIALWSGPKAQLAAFLKAVAKLPAAADLTPLTGGGPDPWPMAATSQGILGTGKSAYVSDAITLPSSPPYGAWFRPSGFDFFPGGKKIALCNISGDVWIVDGVDADLQNLTWKRIATGFFQPLGLRIVNNEIYVLGRDQITRLHDLNGDGATDYYESFNSDVEVTWNFHEFTFDLQSDDQGNFYYSKGSPVRNGGRGFDYIAKHHGTVVKVSPDGKSSEVWATGLRAPNGISVRGDGQVTTGDNEGSWMPQCRLNLVEKGGFYGVVPTAHRAMPPTIYDAPICWFPKDVDNSSGGQAWVSSDKWGPFQGDLLHLSYGTSSLFKVMYEKVDGIPQGGVVKLPVAFASSAMRARFNPTDGQLYIGGLRGWQTNAATDGALTRVRFTGAPVTIPTALHVVHDGIEITFTRPLDKKEAVDIGAYSIKQWNYLYSEAYGSDKYSLARPGEKGEDSVVVQAAKLSADGKTVKLTIPGIQPVMQMQIAIDLIDADDQDVRCQIYNTINKVPAN